MCRSCWIDYGEPSIVNERTRKAAALIERLYDEFSCGGGNCHIVVDDWNLEDSNIQFCLDEVAKGGYRNPQYDDPPDTPEQLALEKEILDLMKSMPLAERVSAMAIRAWFVRPSDGEVRHGSE